MDWIEMGILVIQCKHKKSMTLVTSKFRMEVNLLVNWLDREIY